MTPIEVDTDEPHKCIVPNSVFRKSPTSFGTRIYNSNMFSSSGSERTAERAISNELRRIASKKIVGEKKLEKRVEVLEKENKELKEQVGVLNDENQSLKRRVTKLEETLRSINQDSAKVAKLSIDMQNVIRVVADLKHDIANRKAF